MFELIIFIKIFLCLQNHFLKNRYEPKIFINTFSGKFFVAKSFPWKQVWTKTFYIIAKSLCRNQSSHQKFLWSKTCEVVLRNYFANNKFQQHLQKNGGSTISAKKKVEIFFYCCEIIFSKIVDHQKFSSKISCWKKMPLWNTVQKPYFEQQILIISLKKCSRKLFMVAKSFPRR